jgi:hypothetical protein
MDAKSRAKLHILPGLVDLFGTNAEGIHAVQLLVSMHNRRQRLAFVEIVKRNFVDVDKAVHDV